MLINRKRSGVKAAQPKAPEVRQSSSRLAEARLRDRRSPAYVKAMKQLDVGHGQLAQHQVNELLDELKQDFPDVELYGSLLGIVSKCYLGEDFEVHTLDTKLEIIEHYRAGQALPGALHKARSLANSTFYEFIEVYEMCLCAVDHSGRVSIIKG